MILAVLLTGASPAKAGACDAFLRAFNTYDEFENGKLEEKHSVFELTEWSNHSSFEGILANSTVPEGAEVTLEYRKVIRGKVVKSAKSGFTKWALDPHYRKADIDTVGFFGKELTSGTYTIRLRNGDKILCEQTEAVLPPD